MADPKKFCFVIIPFSEELNFFYLYLRSHLSEKFDIDVERGDYQVLTKPLADKIREYLHRSDIVIADITGHNPNVMYELGYADAIGKPIILITRDQIEDAPADIRHYEFIKYKLSEDRHIISKLSNALSAILIADVRPLYARAEELLQSFNDFRNTNHRARTIEDFRELVTASDRPPSALMRLDARSFAQIVLPKIVADTSDFEVMDQIVKYLESLN